MGAVLTDEQGSEELGRLPDWTLKADGKPFFANSPFGTSLKRGPSWSEWTFTPRPKSGQGHE